ncbi:MAG: alkaline phosphatase [SAR86 cluster bacterium]|nr:alkaline phosphatase [SAR86 cluster bacterium]
MNAKQIFIPLSLLLTGLIGGHFFSDLLGLQTKLEKDFNIKKIVLDIEVPKKELKDIKNPAKNVILLIGDGMSVSQISVYRLLKGGPNHRVSFDRFPFSGIVLTHSEDALITDSASSATAYSTGQKTKNRYLGLDSKNNSLENLTETLDRYKFVSSLIATSEITHATPAAFASHVESRWDTDQISKDLVSSKVATLLGGGRNVFNTESNGGVRKDKEDLYETLKSSTNLLTTKQGLMNFDLSKEGRVFGLFADNHLRDMEDLSNHPKEPSLSEMLQFALDRFDHHKERGCEGFFIMAEGSQVDWSGHTNNLKYLEREMDDLDDAINLSYKFALDNQETLVIVTSDHETGGLLIESEGLSYTGNKVKFSYNTDIGKGNHTGVPVPVYAFGPGAENFTGTLDNTDIYHAIIKSLGIGQQSVKGSCIR